MAKLNDLFSDIDNNGALDVLLKDIFKPLDDLLIDDLDFDLPILDELLSDIFKPLGIPELDIPEDDGLDEFFALPDFDECEFEKLKID